MLFDIYELPAKDHYIICLEHLLFEKKFQIVDLIGEGPPQTPPPAQALYCQ